MSRELYPPYYSQPASKTRIRVMTTKRSVLYVEVESDLANGKNRINVVTVLNMGSVRALRVFLKSVSGQNTPPVFIFGG